MRERHRHHCGADNRVGRNGNSQRQDRGQRRDSDLNLCTALIAGRALLQTGVLVNGLAAIAVVIGLRESHGRRRRSLYTRLCNPDRLGKKHPRREKAADRAANCGTDKYHECLTLKIKTLRHCMRRIVALSSLLNRPLDS